MTLLPGFIMAESAEMGRRIGLDVSAMSMMTTCAVSPTFSRTQMNLSDSIVSMLKPMLDALMPTLVSWWGTEGGGDTVSCDVRPVDDTSELHTVNK